MLKLDYAISIKAGHLNEREFFEHMWDPEKGICQLWVQNNEYVWLETQNCIDFNFNLTF